MIATLKSAAPWWSRIAAKLVISRLPIPYHVWKRIGVFEHGDMDQPERALEGFLLHARTAGVLTDSDSSFRDAADGTFSVLEIGPGDSLFDALIAHALGATDVWMIDAGPFATTCVPAYAAASDLLRESGLPAAAIGPASTLRDVLTLTGTRYLTAGVSSLATVPDGSVDYSFSNAVLEHIPLAEFDALCRQLYRLHRPGSVSVHRVDLKDHLGGGLNNLRFSQEVWEGKVFSTSGFYTNRLRMPEILTSFTAAGFEVTVTRTVRWDALPTPRSLLAPAFARMTDDVLRVSGFDVVLTVPV